MNWRTSIVRSILLASVFISWQAACAEPKELNALRARLEAMRAAIANAEDAKGEAREELRDSEMSISHANRELRELGRKRDLARAELRTLVARKSAIEVALAQKEREIGTFLAATYRQGAPSHIRMLLSGDDPNRAARNMHYVAQLVRAQTGLLETMRDELAKLREVETERVANNQQIAQIEASQQSQRAQLLAQQAERRKVLNKLSAQLRAQQREVKGLERDQIRLSQLVEEIAKVVAAKPTQSQSIPAKPAVAGSVDNFFANLKGRLSAPLRGVLVHRFGATRPDGGPSWKGLFFRAAAGVEIRAVAPGRVVFADWMRGFGNLLIVDHGGSYLSIYGNNESLLRAVGDTVGAGDSVATVGASGGGEDSGLYFELRHEGKAFDPEKWLLRR
ncbi:MAG: murein hydrolase activator EnvC family protein [Burkholderiales bacterium]